MRTSVKTFLSLFVTWTLIISLFTACGDKKSDLDKNSKDGKIRVAVAILPLKDFVEKIGGDKVEVTVAIPKGASPANYEPAPKEIKEIMDSDVYFSLEMPTEKGNILPKLEEEGINIVYLDKDVDENFPPRMFDDEHEEAHEDEGEHSDDGHGHSHEGRDPHIWTSPKRAIFMCSLIADKLSVLSPENSEFFADNTKVFAEEIGRIDKKLTEKFKDNPVSFLVFHPSLGYFADDYGLEMLAIESDGKKAGAKHLKEIIDLARQKDIKTVLYQHEFYDQSAKQIAGELGGEALGYTVLWEDYLEGLQSLGDMISGK